MLLMILHEPKSAVFFNIEIIFIVSIFLTTLSRIDFVLNKIMLVIGLILGKSAGLIM